jgi:DNA recombination protein RmuC
MGEFLILLVGVVGLGCGFLIGWWVTRQRVLLFQSDISNLSGKLQGLEASLERARLERQELDETYRAAQIELATVQERAKRLDPLLEELEQKSSELAETKMQVSSLEARQEERDLAFAERLSDLTRAEEQLKNAFASLSSEALKASQAELTKQTQAIFEAYQTTVEKTSQNHKHSLEALLAPFREKLQQLEEHNASLDKQRIGAYEELKASASEILRQSATLKDETIRLTEALKNPNAAGAWGEKVLEKVLEMSGLDEHWGYRKQVTESSADGMTRPDVVVSFAGGKNIIIDSKASLGSYLDALNETDPIARKKKFSEHASTLLRHAQSLSKKNYLRRSEDSPEFVVLFVGSEGAFRAAIEARPEIMDEAIQVNVVLACPSTLFALLRSVAHGWRQEVLVREIQEIQKTAAELYDRLCSMSEQYSKLGDALRRAGVAFNDFGSRLDSSVFHATIKLRNSGVTATKKLSEVPNLEFVPRQLTRLEPAARNGTDS